MIPLRGMFQNREYLLFPYSLQMQDGSCREGRFVQTPAGEQEGWGDAAPLSGWSRETFAELDAIFQNEHLENPFPPSLAFAMDCASASAQEWSEFAPKGACIEIAALGHLMDPNLDTLLKTWVTDGCETVKLKVPCAPPEILSKKIHEVRNIVGSNVRLRIDANRCLEEQAAQRLCSLLETACLEFFEEPLHNPSALPALIADSPVPIALDETLREVPLSELERFHGAAAAVLKPTLTGSFANCQLIVQRTRELGMKPVISACYESGLGIDALARLAAHWTPETPAGLDTYSRIAVDAVMHPPIMKNWRMSVSRSSPTPITER